MTIKLLIANKHKIVNQGICSMLSQQDEIHVVGVAEDQNSTIDLCQTLNPDVIVMSLGTQNLYGIELMRNISKNFPEKKIVVFSRSSERHTVIEMINAGARAYVTTKSSFEEFMLAIRAAAEGRFYLCQEASETVMTCMVTKKSEEIKITTRLCSREEQVLRLIADGYSSKEIAQQLGISPSTVEVHRRNIMRKVGLHKVAELTRYAIRSSLIAA